MKSNKNCLIIIIIIIILKVILVRLCTCQFKTYDISNGHTVFEEFVSEVNRFCQDKKKENFCSTAHVKIMFDINERKRLEHLEFDLKRMEKQIIRNILKMSYIIKT